MPSANEPVSEAVTSSSESSADTAQLQEVVSAVEQFHEDTSIYLDYINSGLILSIVLSSLILGALVARFFFERLR